MPDSFPTINPRLPQHRYARSKKPAYHKNYWDLLADYLDICEYPVSAQPGRNQCSKFSSVRSGQFLALYCNQPAGFQSCIDGHSLLQRITYFSHPLFQVKGTTRYNGKYPGRYVPDRERLSLPYVYSKPASLEHSTIESLCAYCPPLFRNSNTSVPR